VTSTRLLAAVVGLAVVLPLLFWGGLVGIGLVVGVGMAISAAEYAKMAFPDDRVFAFVWLTLGIGVVAVGSTLADGPRLQAIAALVVVATMAQVLFRPGPDLEGAAGRLGRYLLGIAWISLFVFLVRLRQLDHGVAWVVLALAVSWLSDTGAYFAGRRFGKRKLYPRVSPAKTWEGLLGGLATAIVGVFVMRDQWLPDIGVVDAIVLGAGGSITSVVGDLCESLLKRAFAVKDSGWIMPGHGGMLDRIDSVLFVAPTVWSYWILVHGS
jgi:phosphatidate cytidylyltransferase